MRLNLVLLFCLHGLGCKESQTQVLLVVHFDPSQGVDQIQISAQSEARSFPTVRRPEVAGNAPFAEPQSVALILPDEIAGHDLTLAIAGLRQGTVVAQTTLTVIPIQGQQIAVDVWLGKPRLDGGLDGQDGDGGGLKDAMQEKTPCSPNTFLGCQGTALLRCNGSGLGTVTQDCKPFSCNTAAGRCNECDPAASPSCSNATLIECTAEGLKKSTVCPLGCSVGACCVDADKDSVSTCAGDCDDMDPNAYPGQTGFFSVPTKGKSNFDFNCDKTEEKEVKDLVNCVRTGSNCQGHGWQGSVPDCGVQAVFITCKPSGPTSCSHDQSQKVQGCR